MNHSSFPSRRVDLRAFVLPALIVIVWAAITGMHLVNTKIVVPPELVLSTARSELSKPDFYLGVLMSLRRNLIGFSLGATAGIAVGVLLGVSSLAAAVVGPTFHTFRQISLFAWLPLLSAVAGTSDPTRIIFIAFSAFYPIVLGTLEGVKGVSQAHAEVARIYGFTRLQTFWRLILPAASPQILSGVKLGLIYAWMATIGAEFLLVSTDEWHGIGRIVFRGRSTFNVDIILFGLFAIGLIGFGFNRLADLAEARLLRWRAPQNPSNH